MATTSIAIVSGTTYTIPANFGTPWTIETIGVRVVVVVVAQAVEGGGLMRPQQTWMGFSH